MNAYISRRFALSTLGCAFAIASPLALALDFPTKTIRIIVPYSAGGTTDLVVRTVGQKAAEILKQTIVVENRGGAGGNIGMDVVAKAAPDGYTLGLGAISTNALNPHLYKSMPFDPRKDFTPVGLLGTSTIVLEVPATSSIMSVQDLVAQAKKSPGLPYATAGSGTSMHLAAELFAQATGVQLTHVPYKGSGPALTDLMGGTLGVMFDNLPASLPHIQSGKLRALAVAGSARTPSLPQVPTMAEAGLKGYAVDPWFGLYGPAGMPPEIVTRLNQAFNEALARADVREQLQKAGFAPRGSTAEELGKLGQAEYLRFGEVVRKAGIKMD